MKKTVHALDVVASDFSTFEKTLDLFLSEELTAFQAVAKQFAIADDLLALDHNLRNVSAQASALLVELRDVTFEDATLWSAVRRIELLDSLLEQKARLLVVTNLRGAEGPAAEQIKKLLAWSQVLRDWMAGVRKQLAAIAGES